MSTYLSEGKKYKLEKLFKNANLSEDPLEEAEILNSFRYSNHPLPIEKFARELMYTIDNSNVVIVMGETGCGKTTKIPEYLYRSYNQIANSLYKVAHVLPRKIATMTIAERICKNLKLTIGKEIGYSVRFDYNYSKDTRIKFLTEGMILREMLIDPLLTMYNVVIIDDCHERTINSELILGFLKKITKKRKDLKIIISSATLDYHCYLNFFSKEDGYITNVFRIPGRNYPVDIFYLDKPVDNYIHCAVLTAMSIHKNNPKLAGDLLIFLPGQEEINLFLEYSAKYAFDQQDVVLLPLCSGLPSQRQLEVFAPAPQNKRKIIISTNIAEASVTIENIAFVIDSCFVKMKFYNPKNDSDALFIISASKFSLDQRAGRAGRTRPGQCFRLITEKDYHSLHQMASPELMRNNLREFILRIKSMGVKELSKFHTLTPLEKNNVARALESLYFLELIDNKTNLTELGIKVCDIPIDPRLAVALYSSGELRFKCVEEVLTIVAMLSVQNLFHQPKDPLNLMKAKQRLGIVEGDHLSLLSIFKQYKRSRSSKGSFCKDIYLSESAMKEVDMIIHNLKPYLKKYNIPVQRSLDQDGEDIIKCFLKGFFLNIAQKQSDGSYRSLRWNIPFFIHPTSVLYTIMPEFILYNEVVTTAKIYVKDVSRIDKSWILEASNKFYEDKTTKAIQERHIEEIKTQMTATLPKSAINKTNSNISDTLFNTTASTTANISIENRSEAQRQKNKPGTAQSSSNRMFMNIDKNKDYSHYFADSDDDTCQKEKKKDMSNITKETTNDNASNIHKKDSCLEDNIEAITMQRRKRNRQNMQSDF